MPATLAELVDTEMLEALSGDRAFERGEDYFASGKVADLKQRGETLSARVRGTYDYEVRLRAQRGKLAFDCSCPVGQDRVFCKHCVAAGLAWIEQEEENGGNGARRAQRDDSEDEPRAFLEAQDKSSLVELILEHAEWDSEFRSQISLKSARQSAGPPDKPAYYRAIDQAIRVRGVVEYHRMRGYAHGIEDVVDSLDELMSDGHAVEVRALTERALSRLETAMSHLDDSDGWMGGILDRLQELHHRACLKIRPEPKALAKFLFRWEVDSGWEIFYGAAEIYSDVLGRAGLDEYRKLAETRWAKIPALGPGKEDSERFGNRFRITEIMEALARNSGDVAELVSVKSRDLSHAFSFLQIAEVYVEAGNHDAALEWAERGARAFPHDTNTRLLEFLIEEYHRRGRHDDANAIAWKSFEEQPGLHSYQSLHKSARRANRWREWREKALALFRETIADRKRKSVKNEWSAFHRVDHSVLVEVYLWEGHLDAAWKEAKSHGCHERLWRQLAEQREKDHPEDAIAVYTDLLKPTLLHADKRFYAEAVALLSRIHKLTSRLAKQSEFASLVQSIRAQHRARRNLIKLLDEAGWQGV